MKKDIVTKIEKGTYVGYYWFSDKTTPEVLDKEPFEFTLANNQNPFIIEAQLYDEENSASYSIRFVDGHYVAIRYLIESDDINLCDTNVYQSKGMNGKRLKFFQRWQDEPDTLCEGMDVLVPCEQVFVGFEK